MTPDSAPIVNGLSPDRINRGGATKNNTANSTHIMWNKQLKLNNEMIQQLTLTQYFLRAKGKKASVSVTSLTIMSH